MHSIHLVIRGRVQGVGFRHFVRSRAVTLGLVGWVKNRSDGAVEVEARGTRDALESLLAAARQGPTGAQVTDMEQAWGEAEAGGRDFRVLA